MSKENGLQISPTGNCPKEIPPDSKLLLNLTIAAGKTKTNARDMNEKLTYEELVLLLIDTINTKTWKNIDFCT